MSRHGTTCILVSYDIVDDKRRSRVYNVCRGYGQHIQYSVFRCDLTDSGRGRLVEALDEIIHHDEDQILFVTVGPTDGRAQDAFDAIGLPYRPPPRSATVV